MLRRLLIAAGVLLASSGCGASDEGAAPDRTTLPIVNGEPSGTEDEAVVHIGAFTATLIAPNLLLTCRHCLGSILTFPICSVAGDFLGAGAGEYGALVDPPEIAVLIGSSDTLPDPVAFGSEIVVVPGANNVCQNDIALIILDRSLDIEPKPVDISPVEPGQLVRAVGYGTEIHQRRTRPDVAIEVVGKSELHPNGFGAPPNMFAIGPSASSGDSGGPALTEGGAIAGVFSFFAGAEGANDARSFYVETAAYRDLIQRAADQAGTSVEFVGEADGPADAGSVDGGEPTEPRPGSGCALAGDGSESTGGAAWLVIGLLVSWRRRRRSRARVADAGSADER